MDYKEKYEQALMIAQETYNTQPMYREWIEKMFPELKESEGEKVRKELIKHLKEGAEGYEPAGDSSDYQRWLAWVENQSEQKPVEWSEDDEVGFGDVLWAIEQARTIAKDENNMGNLWCAERWLKSLRPQNTWKPSSEQMKALNVINVIGGISYAGQGQVLIELYNDLKKLKEGNV